MAAEIGSFQTKTTVLRSEEQVLPKNKLKEQSNQDDDNFLLSLQIRTFLEASQDVDIDPETVEELLQTLSEVDGEGDVEATLEVESGVQDYVEEDVEVYPPEFGHSAAYESDEQEEVWSTKEVKQMLHHLKENGMESFIKKYVYERDISIPNLLQAFGVDLCTQLQNKSPRTMLYFLRVLLSHQLRLRDKLPQYNTIADAVQLIQNSKRILVLTGAGISVSCGIPDFRSRDGLYASLKDRGEYDLDDPQQMFDIDYFRENPSVFYSFASQIYPSNFSPSPCHRFIKLVEDKGKLLRNYTQNIDTLETLAGVQHVLQCHGSFATASCLQCRRRVLGTEIEDDILNQRVPLCSVCNTSNTPTRRKAKKGRKKAQGMWDSDDEDESDGPEFPPGIMKPDITFFGEKLTDDFDHSLAEDQGRVDLLLVIGTSLKVSPVADILSHLRHSIPQILINKTPIRHINPDIVLLGNADEIVAHICKELNWELKPPSTLNSTSSQNLRENQKRRASSDPPEQQPAQRVGESHVWLFNGAEGGNWLRDFQKKNGSDTPMVVDSRSSTRPSSPGNDTKDLRDLKKPRFN